MLKPLVHNICRRLPYPLSLWYHRSLYAWRVSDVSRRRRQRTMSLFKKIGAPSRILAGPFHGMRYLSDAAGSLLLPKLVGSYELELEPYIRWFGEHRPDRVIDIGAAEGYYAVGLARNLPDAQVIAFEISERALALTDHLARKNGVRTRIDLRGACTIESLTAALRGSRTPAILSDCEGAEGDLLVPDLIPELRRTTVLVEVHDEKVPGVYALLRARFASSHDIQEIAPSERVDLPVSVGGQLSAAERMELMDEGRSTYTCWFFMTPRT